MQLLNRSLKEIVVTFSLQFLVASSCGRQESSKNILNKLKVNHANIWTEQFIQVLKRHFPFFQLWKTNVLKNICRDRAFELHKSLEHFTKVALVLVL